MTGWGTVADWVVAVGTLVVAAVAVFQETIRGWFYRPALHASIKTEPPDCVAVPMTWEATFVANSVYLRLWIENGGNATARIVEVYARELRRRRADRGWERVAAFPPMNLRWANGGIIYFPTIAPKMGKHCDLAHIVDPAKRNQTDADDNPRLNLTAQQTSLAFDVAVLPNHRGHVVGPGEYELDILVAAKNARPVKYVVTIDLRGPWFGDEA